MKKSDYKDMWVYIEHDGKTIHPVSLELCSEARKLCDASGDVLAAVIVNDLPQKELEKVLEAGVEKLILVSGTGYETFSVDAYTHLFTVLCKKYMPSAVFVGGTIAGRDFAPRFACRLLTGCTSDATQLIYNEKTGDIEFIEPAVGGKMMAVITVPELRPQVGTIRPGTFKYQPAGRRNHEIIREIINFPVDQIRTRVLSFTAEDLDDSLNIADAEVIVCVGSGIKGADSLPRYRKLASLLGGKIGCTRPVFDRGILPFKLVIGQSGVVVKPKLYLAFGVSGAVNHVTGITDSDKVVAINKDPDAAIFHYCDYGIVGEMDEICDLMIRRLEAEKTQLPILQAYDLTVAQYKFLKYLFNAPKDSVRIIDLETAFSVTHPAAIDILKVLEKKGYSMRIVNPEDARSKIVSLTEKAYAEEALLRGLGDEMEDAVTKRLSKKEKEQLIRLLKKLVGI